MEEKPGQKESAGENSKKTKPLSSKRESKSSCDNRCEAKKGTGVCSGQPGEWSRHRVEEEEEEEEEKANLVKARWRASTRAPERRPTR